MNKVALTLLLVMFANTAITETESQEFSFGVVPQQSAKRLAQLWTPILQYLSQETGYVFKFKTAKHIPIFEQRLAKGQYHFAYMNPYHFTVFNRNPGYKAVVRRKKQPIRGIVVVRKDSQITSLEELHQKKLAFPAPAAFAASLLPRAHLKNNRIEIKPHYVSSHDSVYMSVAKGLFPAGGGVKRTFNNTKPEIKDQLKVLWKTEAYTPHAIAAHPDIPRDVLKKVQKAFVKMSKNSKGEALLKSIKVKNGLQAANDQDWDDVKALNIGLLDKLVK